MQVPMTRPRGSKPAWVVSTNSLTERSEVNSGRPDCCGRARRARALPGSGWGCWENGPGVLMAVQRRSDQPTRNPTSSQGWVACRPKWNRECDGDYSQMLEKREHTCPGRCSLDHQTDPGKVRLMTTTDYDAPRRLPADIAEDSLEELTVRRTTAQSATADVDEAEVEGFELPGAELPDEE